jgi:hypothetical protein
MQLKESRWCSSLLQKSGKRHIEEEDEGAGGKLSWVWGMKGQAYNVQNDARAVLK